MALLRKQVFFIEWESRRTAPANAKFWLVVTPLPYRITEGLPVIRDESIPAVTTAGTNRPETLDYR